jgi:5'-nucleotidase (lipoprotein e(P4) family)
VPGSVEFINYINTNGGKVFFVSNRDESTTKDSNNNNLEMATMRNMKKLGFKGVNEETLLLKGEFTNDGNTAKQWRMEAVSNGETDGVKRHVVIFMGDNLNDLSEIDKNSNKIRKEFVGRAACLWHRTQGQYGLFSVDKPAYIALPNPMYGYWENGLYDAKKFGKNTIWELTPEQKTILRKESLIKWNNE